MQEDFNQYFNQSSSSDANSGSNSGSSLNFGDTTGQANNQANNQANSNPFDPPILEKDQDNHNQSNNNNNSSGKKTKVYLSCLGFIILILTITYLVKQNFFKSQTNLEVAASVNDQENSNVYSNQLLSKLGLDSANQSEISLSSSENEASENEASENEASESEASESEASESEARQLNNELNKNQEQTSLLAASQDQGKQENQASNEFANEEQPSKGLLNANQQIAKNKAINTQDLEAIAFDQGQQELYDQDELYNEQTEENFENIIYLKNDPTLFDPNSNNRNVIKDSESVRLESVVENLANSDNQIKLYTVQLAAFSNVNDAKQSWHKILTNNFQLVDGYLSYIEINDERTIYRLRLGEFKNYQVASDYCKKLKSQNLDCLVIVKTDKRI